MPHSIGELKHLRYLDLSKNKIDILPNSITKLLNLLTLKLNNCSGLKELPRDIKKLVNLRNLDIFGCGLTHMPLGLRYLTSLYHALLRVKKVSMLPGRLEDGVRQKRLHLVVG